MAQAPRRRLLQAGLALPWARAGAWAPAAAAAASLARPRAATAHPGPGRVDPPQPAPALPLTLHDGRSSQLPALLAGQATLVQLMFTGCTATCPIQGALFAAVQAGLATRPAPAPARLLSISIDALGDHPAALRGWLQAQGARPGWAAAVPSVAGVEQLFAFLGGRSPGPDQHTAQVYLFDRRGRLALRSADFPSPQQLLGWVDGLARSEALSPRPN
jgi:protein SCO1/2